MKSNQYQIIKYVHDHFTSEFVNVGVVVYDPKSQYLNCKVTKGYKRITQFFPAAKGEDVIQLLDYIERSIINKSKDLESMLKSNISVEGITNAILPKDNCAIQYSDVKMGIDFDLDTALNTLYWDLVAKYSDENDNSTLETLSLQQLM